MNAQQVHIPTLANVEALPKVAQLLLANSLQQGNPNMTLLDSDDDATTLHSAGWLTHVPCSSVGINCCRIKPVIWRRLQSLESAFLSVQLLSELGSYKVRKNALYPWNW